MKKKNIITLTIMFVCLTLTGGVWLGPKMLARAEVRSAADKQGHRLGIEIGLVHTMKVSSPDADHMTEVFLPVSANATGSSVEVGYSAIKLVPRMIGNKLRVKVFVLYGEASGVKTCDEWDTLKQVAVGSFLLGEGEETTVSQLSNLGSSFKAGKLSFKTFSFPADEAGCRCSSCDDGSVCCPATGHCINCGTCGQVCCKVCPPRGCIEEYNEP